MRVKIVERKVLNPLADTAVQKIKLATLTKKIKKLSLVDNTKPHADLILDIIGSELKDIHLTHVKKPAGAPATPEQIKNASNTDVSILAVGDCGSCATWLILDALRLEKVGATTISICSSEFLPFARKLAQAQGADDLKILEIPHPISGQEKEEIEAKTRNLIPEIKKILNME